MIAFIEKIQQSGGTRHEAREIAKAHHPKAGKGRPRHFIFRYQPKEKSFSLSLQFRKSQVPREEVVAALRAILRELTESD